MYCSLTDKEFKGVAGRSEKETLRKQEKGNVLEKYRMYGNQQFIILVVQYGDDISLRSLYYHMPSPCDNNYACSS